MIIGFAKYEGTGNDFIIIDARIALDFEFQPEFVAALCDRHFGIGADGLMLLELGSGKADFDMRYFNSDGFETTMCGNGGRCIALFAHHQGIGGSEKVFSGADGVHRAKIKGVDDLRGIVELQLNHTGIVEQEGDGFLLDTGSPHYVKFVNGIDDVDVVGEGRKIRNNPAYGPKGVNVNFVEITGNGSFRLRTYERGVEGETQACGTGATAAAIAAHVAKQPSYNHFSIQAQGGPLIVSFNTDGHGLFTDVWLSGAARKVFHGKLETDNFIRLL